MWSQKKKIGEMGNLSIVRFIVDGDHFEIFVKPDKALSFKLGRNVDLSQIIAIDEVYSESSKGLKANSEKLLKHFNTSDHAEAAKIVLEKGDLQLNTDQRRKMIDENRKQIINIIARNYIDPKTGLPHPPLRIEQAIKEINVSIDPFKNIQEQSKIIVEQLRTIIPLKSEKIKIRIIAPPQYSPKVIGVAKGFGNILNEKWGSDGSWNALIEIQGGMHTSMIEKLNSVTKGAVQANVER